MSLKKIVALMTKATSAAALKDTLSAALALKPEDKAEALKLYTERRAVLMAAEAEAEAQILMANGMSEAEARKAAGLKAPSKARTGGSSASAALKAASEKYLAELATCERIPITFEPASAASAAVVMFAAVALANGNAGEALSALSGAVVSQEGEERGRAFPTYAGSFALSYTYGLMAEGRKAPEGLRAALKAVETAWKAKINGRPPARKADKAEGEAEAE